MTVVITFRETRSQKLRSNDLVLNIRYKPSYPDKGIYVCTHIAKNIQERNIYSNEFIISHLDIPNDPSVTLLCAELAI